MQDVLIIWRQVEAIQHKEKPESMKVEEWMEVIGRDSKIDHPNASGWKRLFQHGKRDDNALSMGEITGCLWEEVFIFKADIDQITVQCEDERERSNNFRWRCDIMEVEASRVHNSVYHWSWVHSSIGSSEWSNLAAPTVSRLLNQKPNWPTSTDHLLWLRERNTPHQQSRLSCQDEAHWGMVSSYPGARNREETWSLEDRHRGEHRRLPDKATPKSTLRSTNDEDGATTSDRAEESQTRSRR